VDLGLSLIHLLHQESDLLILLWIQMSQNNMFHFLRENLSQLIYWIWNLRL